MTSLPHPLFAGYVCGRGVSGAPAAQSAQAVSDKRCIRYGCCGLFWWCLSVPVARSAHSGLDWQFSRGYTDKLQTGKGFSRGYRHR
eukprot:1147266-Pelagomonas_calceolata.AAC.4